MTTTKLYRFECRAFSGKSRMICGIVERETVLLSGYVVAECEASANHDLGHHYAIAGCELFGTMTFRECSGKFADQRKRRMERKGVLIGR